MYHIFLIPIAFQSSDWVELDLCGSAIRISLNLKSQGAKKIEVFSQLTDDSKNFSCENLYIADYKYVNHLQFCCVRYKDMTGRR